MTDQYTIEGTAPNLTIRQGDRVIRPDPNDQEFCDVLTWASQQKPVPEELAPLAVGWYFAEKTRFVAFCKDTATCLYVWQTPPNAPPNLPRGLAVASYPEPASSHIFTCIEKAISQPHGQPIRMQDGLSRAPTKIFVTDKLRDQLQGDLLNAESDVRKLSSWPVEKTFIYFDISDYSTFPAGQQALIVNALVALTAMPFWPATGPWGDAIADVEAMLCIGDGYIFVARRALSGFLFASKMASLIDRMRASHKLPVDFHFRASVHTGEVYRFWDRGRDNWNYIGDGINGGQRVLTAVGNATDDVLFISSDVRDRMLAEHGDGFARHYFRAMQNRGRHADKHGNLWRVYEVNHSEVAPADIPPDWIVWPV